MKTLNLVLVSLAAFMAIEHCKAAKPRELVLTLNAEVTCADGDPSGAYALLFIDGRLVDSTSVEDGGFTLDLPLGTEATLELHKPGFVSKSVIIGSQNLAAPKDISCDFLLFPQPQGERLDYTRPVGRITFDATSGEMQVEHDYQLSSSCVEEATGALIASDR